jgi:hypothetical protein
MSAKDQAARRPARRKVVGDPAGDEQLPSGSMLLHPGSDVDGVTETFLT